MFKHAGLITGLARRTSQFPQDYSDFEFEARNNAYYLGLQINNIGMSSVLNSAVEWRGSWAIDTMRFTYEITPATGTSGGDMLVLMAGSSAHGSGRPSCDAASCCFSLLCSFRSAWIVLR